MVRWLAESRGMEEGDVCLTSMATYRGVELGVIPVVVLGVSESESDAGVHLCDACVTGVTGVGNRAGDGDKDDRGDRDVVVTRACALLLVVSGMVHEGSQDRLRVVVVFLIQWCSWV